MAMEKPLTPFRLLVRQASLLFLVALGACASTPTVSVEDVLAANPSIAELQGALNDPQAKVSELLAPTGHREVASKLDEAIKAAQSGNIGEADALAAAGLQALKETNAAAAKSGDLFREVLEARQRANKAGAWQILPEKATDLDRELRDAASKVEEGKLDSAKELRQALIDGYADLELVSLKEGAVEMARATIAHAEDNGAADRAPKTFKLAQEEMSLVISILDANREDTDRANQHAIRATSLAQQSIQIAELIKDFDRRDYTREDALLWYQSQLAEIYEPIGEDLPFDEPNREVVLAMQQKYASLLRSESSAELEAMQQQTELEMRERVEAERKARFDQVQSMFRPDEATVYRQRENVLISAHGFQFPVGKSEFESRNFEVANKVIEAIALFPDSTIEVTGHTDSTGSAETNMRLSRERAANVKKFLHEIGQIPESRLSSEGFGKERPVASNETEETRAQNRRVEILINNE